MIFTFITLTITIHEYFSNKPIIKIDCDDLDNIMNSFYYEEFFFFKKWTIKSVQ